MKYIIAAIMMSTVLMVVAVAVLITVFINPPENIMRYMAWAWVILAVLCYPLARKIVRE